MVEFTSKILERLSDISQNIFTGNPAADLMFFAVVLLSVFVLILSFLIVRRPSADPKPPAGGFDRIAGVAGKVERFEMNINTIRTELARDVAFLKNRVADLEGHVRELRDHLELDPIIVGEIKTDSIGLKRDSLDLPSKEPEQDDQDLEVDAFEEEVSSGEIAPPPDYQDTQEDLADLEEALEPQPLKSRLSKTRRGLFDTIKNLFVAGGKLDEDMLDELEALLIGADLGVGLTQDLLTELREEVKAGAEITQSALLASLKVQVLRRLQRDTPLNVAISPSAKADGPTVVMLVGVNGVGKTTTAAKLASLWNKQGAKVLLVAADTFRAAAVEQLQNWGERIGVQVVTGAEEGKPATVVFDAMERAKREKTDVFLIDTAGRLHTKSNLMQELEGIKRVIEKHQPSAPHEVLLVVDGTTGQNALSQAQQFNESVEMTGLVVTKLDGTAKGGIVVAMKDQIGVPIRYIGVGESEQDLRIFEPRAFVDALFDDSDGAGSGSRETAHGNARRRRRNTSGV